MANAILGDGHLLAILALTAISVSTLPGSALAQQPAPPTTACSNFQVGTATYMRCRGQSTRDFLIPKSNGTTDPAAVGKPYGAWGTRFGGQRWDAPGK